MLQTLSRQLSFTPDDRALGIRDNLDDLRGQLTVRLALLALAVAQLMLLFYNPPVKLPLNMLMGWGLLTLFSTAVLWLNGRWPLLARWVLAWGLLAYFMLLLTLFPLPWLPYLGSVLIFVAAVLVRGSEIVTAVTIGATAVFLQLNHQYPYDLSGILITLALCLAVTWLIARNLTITLDWVWHMNQRAEELLATTRNQQAELRSANKSLKIVNDLREHAERELLMAHKQLRQAQQLKEQFAANISHELRTPLSIILGFSEVMYLSPELYGEASWPPTLVRDVAQIYRNSRHLLGMIDDILDLSRFEMVGFTLQKEPTPLAPLLQETAVIVAGLFEASPDLTLQLELPPKLPTLELDQTRIRQVLLNLLNNARRYAKTGVVTLSAALQNDEILISVRDSGPGIPPEKLPHIFTEFYQVDHALNRQYGGAGLGLAICQRFVEAHDGRIWAESELGVGSVFCFTLPLPDRKPLAKLHNSTPVEPGPESRRPSVLFVDSDPAVARLVQRHLEQFQLIAMPTFADMAANASLYHPVAAICNVRPGDSLASQWQHDTVPLIECSLPSQAWLADMLTAVASLTKPINFEQLKQEISRLGPIQTVLIVDDNPGICQLVERGLRGFQADLQIRIAYDGRTGLNLMQQEAPDLLILDLMMPQMDGLEVRAAMQADPTLSQLPVILLTATASLEEALAQYGGQITIAQPASWHPGDTLRCLDGILGSLKNKNVSHTITLANTT